MSPTRSRRFSRWTFAVLLAVAPGAAAGAQQMMPGALHPEFARVASAARWKTTAKPAAIGTPAAEGARKAETFKDFDLAKLGSTERVKLADLRGKVVLVDFWFPGCHWCSVEFPHLQTLVDKYGARGFVVLTINTLPSTDAKGIAMMAKQGYHFTHLTAPTARWATEIYKANAAPTTVLLDQNGKVILRHVGFSLSGLRGMDAAIEVLVSRQ